VLRGRQKIDKISNAIKSFDGQLNNEHGQVGTADTTKGGAGGVAEKGMGLLNESDEVATSIS